MYLPKLVLALLTISSVVQSCGPSETEQRNKAKALIDSVRTATESATLKKVADEEQIKREARENNKLEAKCNADKKNVTTYIASLQVELEVQKGKLEDIKSPKFLRTVSKKEDQYDINLQLSKIFNLRLTTQFSFCKR